MDCSNVAFFMKNMESKLTYRDAIVQIFSGIFLNISLFLFFGEQSVLNVETMSSASLFLIVFLPICFLEGNLLLALDNIIFFTTFKKDCKFSVFEKFPRLFLFFYSNRIIGQVLVHLKNNEKENPITKESFKEFYKKIIRTKDNETSSRYCTLNDFFKGVVLILLFDTVMSLCQLKYIYAIIFFGCLFLSYCRGIKYAHLYVLKKTRLIKEENGNDN